MSDQQAYHPDDSYTEGLSLGDIIADIQSDVDNVLVQTEGETAYNDPELFNDENNGDLSYMAYFHSDTSSE